MRTHHPILYKLNKVTLPAYWILFMTVQIIYFLCLFFSGNAVAMHFVALLVPTFAAMPLFILEIVVMLQNNTDFENNFKLFTVMQMILTILFAVVAIGWSVICTFMIAFSGEANISGEVYRICYMYMTSTPLSAITAVTFEIISLINARRLKN